MKSERVSLSGKPVHDRTSRIAESHHLGTFVESLPYGIIRSLSEYLEFQRTVHPDYLRIASRYEKAQVREFRMPVFLAVFFDETCQNMALKMVDFHQRPVKGYRETFCE